jgi:hypothetical protein
MSIRNWQPSKVYCNGCWRWKEDIGHRHCPRGRKGSQTWIDIANFEMGCNKCNQIWPLEDNIFYCSCGHVQKTVYQDTIVALEEGDEIIATDGDLVYVLSRSGVVVVGYRDYPDIGF